VIVRLVIPSEAQGRRGIPRRYHIISAPGSLDFARHNRLK